MTSHLCS